MEIADHLWKPAITPLPAWLEGTLTRGFVASQAALDVYKPRVDEIIRCWFCHKQSFALHGRIAQCYGKRACRTYYVLLPWPLLVTQVSIMEDVLHGERLRCKEKIGKKPKCTGNSFNLKSGLIRCERCKMVKPLETKIVEVVALLEDDLRKELRNENKLLADGGPSWDGWKLTEPWKPRVDLSKTELRRRLASYRYVEQQKTNAGRDPMLDYRKARHDW